MFSLYYRIATSISKDLRIKVDYFLFLVFIGCLLSIPLIELGVWSLTGVHNRILLMIICGASVIFPYLITYKIYAPKRLLRIVRKLKYYERPYSFLGKWLGHVITLPIIFFWIYVFVLEGALLSWLGLFPV